MGNISNYHKAVLCLFVTILVILPFSGSFAGENTDYPIMRPDRETLKKWTADYTRAPKTAINPMISKNLRASAAALTPTSIDLLDRLQYIPGERNQGNCGNCWAWAGTGVIELALFKNYGLKDRFSVEFQDVCNESYPFSCNGGWLSNLRNFYNTTRYAIPWSNTGAAYTAAEYSAARCAAITKTPRYQIAKIDPVTTVSTTDVTQAEAILNIKSVLKQGKGIFFAYFLSDTASWTDFRSFWRNQPESTLWGNDPYCGIPYDELNGGGHAVLIVGYNDDDPDFNNHYWIALNSWSTTDLRPNGLFRIRMNMNYNCQTPPYQALYFQTVDVDYCAYLLSPASRNVDAAAATGEITLTTNGTCSWTAASNASWLTITSEKSGSEGTTIRYAVEANTQALSRTGALTVADKTFTLMQKGIPPVVVLVSPSDGAKDVDIATSVTATFSEAMDASTLNSSTFTVNGGVLGTVTYDAAAKKATFVPTNQLAYFTAYTMTLSTAIKDSEGEPLARPYTWTFTTMQPRPGSSNCFIATAAFGSPLEKHVVILRNFRDAYLIRHAAGRTLVDFYYRYSPPVARFIKGSESFKVIVRYGLFPVTGFCHAALNYGLAVTCGFMVCVIVLICGVFLYRRQLTCFIRRK